MEISPPQEAPNFGLAYCWLDCHPPPYYFFLPTHPEFIIGYQPVELHAIHPKVSWGQGCDQLFLNYGVEKWIYLLYYELNEMFTFCIIFFSLR